MQEGFESIVVKSEKEKIIMTSIFFFFPTGFSTLTKADIIV